ncbi:MAG: PEGA domain-containing protein [Deltaproteobacteria bacterium]|nr:PEGA domain-containing protein [Deltaproteobacteria bacterium]
MRALGTILLTFVALASRGREAQAASGRTIAVLEYRAGVRGGERLASAMASQLARSTANVALDPQEARRRFGPALEAEVARCKGLPACVAALGARLGAQEVILVGVSQLGDLILAIQRIAVPSGRVLARMADSAAPSHVFTADVLLGYLQQLLPPDDFRRYGRIAVRSDVAGDLVLLNGRRQGRTPLSPLVVPAPGRYTIRVRRPGHLDFVARLDVLPEAAVEVTPSLPRAGAPPPRWYQHWWVWAIVGGVVASGATTAAVLGLRRSPDSVDAVVQWAR